MRSQVIFPCVRYLGRTRQTIQTHITPKTRSFSSIIRMTSNTLPRCKFLLSTTHEIHLLKANMSLCRQNYSEECEAGVNRQINLELYASYVYSSMAFHFNRDDVSLPGFYKFFKKMSNEERHHAEKLMEYQNLRGGRIVLQDIKKPEIDAWGSGLEAMMSALKLEKHVNQCLLDLHHISASKIDPQFGDFLEDEFLTDQVESIKQMSDYVTQLNRVGPGFGEYLFDKETLQDDK